MTGKVLIVDSVATNRIIQKVKLVAAQYEVETCADSFEAKIIMANSRPDLVLINISAPIENLHNFCQYIRSHPDLRTIAVIGTGIANTGRARFAALDAGCDDALPLGTGDVFMLAKLRSLLRRKSAVQAWQLRDATSRALGFEEERSVTLAPSMIAVVSDSPMLGKQLAKQFEDGLGQPVKLMTPAAALAASFQSGLPDLLILDGSRSDGDFRELFRLLADFNARGAASFVSHLVMYPKSRPEIGAMLLDLGADDVVEISATSDELCLRARNLLMQKFHRDTLREQVKSGLEAAIVDPLTGLHNRRYAEKQLDLIAANANTTGLDFAVMMVDVDHFKSINDTYGHPAGDAVLKQIADRLRTNFREVDLIARIGGEEFLVAMPNTDVEQAQFVAERMRQVIAEMPFSVPAKPLGLDITVSIGVALGGAASDIDQASPFARADAALYSAKTAGRDAVVMAVNAA